MRKITDNIMCCDGMSASAAELASPFFASLPRDKKFVALLGFCDVHVHFREPGFSYKGTVYAGSRAAAKGGYTAVCTMPNLDPVPDSEENIRRQLEIIERDAVIDVYPYAAITVGERGEKLSDMDALAPLSVAFSGGFLSRPSHQTVLSSLLIATFVKMVFFFVEARALKLDFSFVPGATPKKPFSGLIA